jgi:hypothetical protein
MSDTAIFLKKPAEILRKDHSRVKELFAQYEKLARAETARKGELFLEIREEISGHSRIEEAHFYPELHKVDAEWEREALENHCGFRPHLEELLEMGAGDEGFDGKMKQLRESVERHTRMEETEIFTLAKKQPRKTLQEPSAETYDLLRDDLRDHPKQEARWEANPFYPTLGAPEEAHLSSLLPPPKPDPREKESRGYENWGSE